MDQGSLDWDPRLLWLLLVVLTTCILFTMMWLFVSYIEPLFTLLQFQ
jgi:hypothetical protein